MDKSILEGMSQREIDNYIKKEGNRTLKERNKNGYRRGLRGLGKGAVIGAAIGTPLGLVYKKASFIPVSAVGGAMIGGSLGLTKGIVEAESKGLKPSETKKKLAKEIQEIRGDDTYNRTIRKINKSKSGRGYYGFE